MQKGFLYGWLVQGPCGGSDVERVCPGEWLLSQDAEAEAAKSG